MARRVACDLLVNDQSAWDEAFKCASHYVISHVTLDLFCPSDCFATGTVWFIVYGPLRLAWTKQERQFEARPVAVNSLPWTCPATTQLAMEPLQSFNFRVSSTLSDFEATPLHAPARAEPELKRWLVASAQQPVTAAPFSEIYAAVSSQGGQLPLLASRLTWVAQESARQLQQLQAAGTAADASNPRLKLALSNAFKLALFFLAHMHSRAAAQVGCSGGQGQGAWEPWWVVGDAASSACMRSLPSQEVCMACSQCHAPSACHLHV